MLLGDPGIEKPVRKPFPEKRQPGAFGHGRGHGHDAAVFLSPFNQSVSKNLGVTRRQGCFLFDRPGLHLKGPDPVKMNRVFLRRAVALAFFGQNMNQDRSFQVLAVGKGFNELIEAMPANRAHIFEIKGREKKTGGDEAAERVLASTNELNDVFTDPGHGAQEALNLFFKSQVAFGGQLAAEEGGKSPDIGGDGHLVVVEHHDQLFFSAPRPD